MKLKTLKEFDNYKLNEDIIKWGDKIGLTDGDILEPIHLLEIIKYGLKQEAIKWIKEIMKDTPRDYCSEWVLYHINHLKSDIASGKEVLVWWIEQFFNIKEGDLR